VHQRLAVEFARIRDDDARLRDGELPIRTTAQTQDANPLYLRHTVPGIGTIRSLVWRYDIHAINRLPTVQDVVSYSRLVTGAKASAGTRVGTAGTKIGTAHLPWAFAAAAVVCRRDHPPAQTSRARVETTQDQGTALTGRAHTLARAVDDRRKRHVTFDQAPCFHHEWRGAAEPGASRDTQGMNLPDARDTAAARASVNAQARRGRETLSSAR